jgi:allophanate hydrolase
MARMLITRAGPLATIQDAGRFGMLRYGIGESGPMDRAGFAAAGQRLQSAGAAIEFTRAGLDFVVEEGPVAAGFAGGSFTLARNGASEPWPAVLKLEEGDSVSVRPGADGNYGYVRFDREIDVPLVLGSRATNVTVGLGGLGDRPLAAGDRLRLGLEAPPTTVAPLAPPPVVDGPIRVVWGIHADLFDRELRQFFVSARFRIASQMDRMGVRLVDEDGVFAGFAALSLVSDAVVCGDIQVLGDGSPIVLMRDHQPTGGYPRIATIIGADLDRFAQMRAGTEIRFSPVTVEHALGIARNRHPVQEPAT